MPSVKYAKCRYSGFYAECHYAECHYAECRHAERRGASNDNSFGWLWDRKQGPNSQNFFIFLTTLPNKLERLFLAGLV